MPTFGLPFAYERFLIEGERLSGVPAVFCLTIGVCALLLKSLFKRDSEPSEISLLKVSFFFSNFLYEYVLIEVYGRRL